jgi:deoxyadenosine/deoxycytidine kinase
MAATAIDNLPMAYEHKADSSTTKRPSQKLSATASSSSTTVLVTTECGRMYLTRTAQDSIERMAAPNNIFLTPDKLAEEFAWMMSSLIAWNGNIAATKTTTGSAVEADINEIGRNAPTDGYENHRLRARFFREQTPLLELFARDPKTNAFMFQMDQLRLAQLNYLKAIQMRALGWTVMLDRDPWGNRIFCIANYLLGNIDRAQLRKYEDELKRGGPYLINYIIWLWASPEECHRRMRIRAHSEEVGVTVEYLDLIDRLHFVFSLKEIKNKTNRIMAIDCENFVDPRQLMRKLGEHRLLPPYEIEGNPYDAFYLSVEQRHKIIKDLNNTARRCVIPQVQRPSSPANAHTLEELVEADL